MINLKTTKATVSADNKVSFCGLTYMVTDADAQKLKGILDGMVSLYGTKVSTTPKKEYTAKDVTVEMKASGKKVTLSAYCKKDVWEVLKRRFEAVGGEYDKTVKVINFKTAKDAKAFADNNTVSAKERQSIWAEWNNK